MLQTTLKERIRLILNTRAQAAAALTEVFAKQKTDLSEQEIRDSWLQKLDSAEICADGWYQPPPKGSCVLIGSPEDNYTRLNYDSLRAPPTWPRENIVQHEESLVYAYASPIVRGAGLMGDIGLTLYRGTDQALKDHLIRCLEATAKIASKAEVGMPLCELFKVASELLSSYDLSNSASSLNSGVENIGHTLPWSYEEYSEEEKLCISHGSAEEVRACMSKKRVSINDAATLKIQPTMAFTVEPQIVSYVAPLCSYHMIVAFIDGVKTVVPSFHSLFEVFEMDQYMSPVLEILE